MEGNTWERFTAKDVDYGTPTSKPGFATVGFWRVHEPDTFAFCVSAPFPHELAAIFSAIAFVQAYRWSIRCVCALPHKWREPRSA